MVQQSAYFALQVLDDPLVLHLENPARQNIVPVPHGFGVETMLRGNIIPVVGPLVAFAEELAKAAYRDVAGIALTIDDGRARQRKVNEACELKIVGHLVD